MTLFQRKRKNRSSDINPDDTINYNANDLMDKLHERFFQSFAMTLDIADYVPQGLIDKVYKQIYKRQKKQYKVIFKKDKEYQKWYKERLPQLLAEYRERKLLDQQKNDGGDGE